MAGTELTDFLPNQPPETVDVGRLDETLALGRLTAGVEAGREKPRDFKPGLLLVERLGAEAAGAEYDFGAE